MLSRGILTKDRTRSAIRHPAHCVAGNFSHGMESKVKLWLMVSANDFVYNDIVHHGQVLLLTNGHFNYNDLQQVLVYS